jgi:rare lipoprotein A
MRAIALAIVLTGLLSGCGALSKRDASLPEAKTPPSRSGGYYKDDGPGANPPPNLDSIPDATPRAEPLHRFANRPYQVFGKDYVPFTSVAPFSQQGAASWYGKRYHGSKTSSGETYDMYAMSAAHTVLPIPSYVRVTNLGNGRSVVVRVNDRGPFHGDRVIDLSYTAAYRLGILEAGSAPVAIEAIVPGQAPAAQTPQPVEASAAPAQSPPRVAPATAVTAPNSAAPAPSVAPAQAGGVFLQLGAFAVLESAENFRGRVQRDLAWLAQPLEVLAAGGLYRLQLGPYRSPDEARPVAERIQAELNVRPLVIVR